jgi:hypothetical protein
MIRIFLQIVGLIVVLVVAQAVREWVYGQLRKW